MSNMTFYHFLNHLNEPKRILTLTLDELIMAVIGFMLLVMSNQKAVVSLLSFVLLAGLRYLKKGEGPKRLLVLAYWYLPKAVTQFFLPKLPASHHRVWVI